MAAHGQCHRIAYDDVLNSFMHDVLNSQLNSHRLFRLAELALFLRVPWAWFLQAACATPSCSMTLQTDYFQILDHLETIHCSGSTVNGSIYRSIHIRAAGCAPAVFFFV